MDAAVEYSPSAVGNAFVHQYYHVLHTSPELVHRFYQDASRLSRPDPHGNMASVTTMQAISEQILSPDYGGLAAIIRTVDSQDSLGGGVIVLVTGCLTRANGAGKDFSQTFFLAPQDNGYFVLNDIFRYINEDEEAVEEEDEPEVNQGLANGGTDVVHPSEHDFPAPVEEFAVKQEESSGEEEVYNPPENGEAPAVEQEMPLEEVADDAESSPQATVVDLSPPAPAVVVAPSPPAAAVVSKSIPAVTHEEAPKKTYASIVKVMRDSPAPLMAPTSYPTRPSSTNLERNAAPIPPPAPSEVVAVGSTALESSNDHDTEVEGHSIYIRNLPLNATPLEVEEEFKRFGPIKTDGIQVRIHKMQGFCFGFVEFEVASAVQSAIEASPVMMGGRSVYVEEKRTPGSRFGSRGRFATGRGGFRNDGVRGRGSYAGGGYGRGNFNNRPDFGNRGGGRGGMSRGGDGGYQRVDHLGSNGGRGGDGGYQRVDHLGPNGGRGGDGGYQRVDHLGSNGGRGGDGGYQRVDHLGSNGGRGGGRSVAPRVSASA